MKPAKSKRKAPTRRPAKKGRTYSASQGRANFAEAVDSTQSDNAIIGFERYGQPMAALVPVEAVLIIAGRGKDVDRAKRAAIVEAAALFAENMSGRGPAPLSTRLGAKKAPARKKKKAVGKGV